MAFNPKYSSIPLRAVSDNIGMPDLPIILPYGIRILQGFMDSSLSLLYVEYKGGFKQGTVYSPPVNRIWLPVSSDVCKIYYNIGTTYESLPFKIEPSVYSKDKWCRIGAYDTVKYNYPTSPIYVYFKANMRKIEQQNVVVKYDDEVGTIIPLSQKQFDVLTFTTQPMNADYARLLLDIAEWDNVTFQYWVNNNWSTAINVVKKAEAWQRTTYPKTLGTTIQGSFIIKQ